MDVVEFSASDAAGAKKKSGKHSAKLKRITRDIAEVTYRGPNRPQLTAFDKTGRSLARRDSMRGGGSAATRFRAAIATIKPWMGGDLVSARAHNAGRFGDHEGSALVA